MVFTEDSQLVKDYVLLLKHDRIKLEEIPNIFNLKDVVENVVKNQSNI